MPALDHEPRFLPFREPGEHIPVFLQECLDAMNVQPGHTVVDCTFGFAGHSVEILKRVGPAGKLIAFDLDGENLPQAEPKLAAIGHPFALHHSNFAGIATYLPESVDGLLADLGFSSMQVDDAERGFSFLRDGPLDMRMDRSRGKTAADLLNTLPIEELITAFQELGDEPEAEKIALAIVAARDKKPLSRTRELRDIIRHAAPVRSVRGPGMPSERKQLMLPMTRVFQAIRISVNRELANLQHLLRVIPSVLKPGGVAAIISFHSGEDRLVKTSFRDGHRTGIYSAVAADALRPSETEKAANPRARSAKLRWAKLS